MKIAYDFKNVWFSCSLKPLTNKKKYIFFWKTKKNQSLWAIKMDEEKYDSMRPSAPSVAVKCNTLKIFDLQLTPPSLFHQ